MKRYILFAYEQKYPSGAKDDEIGRYDTVDECVEIFKKLDFFQYYDILDLRTGKWIDPNEVINIDYIGPRRMH
ncbi:MAG: hypothetical protein JWN56_1968 [Sphingobacteriales bacterium]|nr:hypothetical protein [Sphingobacteriales bacterium]